jgi:hypothetical protein
MKRTITLSGRSPITIDEDNWPLIASASDSEHDGQVECQANRKSAWGIKVRQHSDGRAIINAFYSYSSTYQSARDYAARRGVLLPAGTTADAICTAIREVAGDMARAEHNGDDATRWDTLANDCIADMPAEELV